MDPTITASGAGQPLPSVISVKHRRTRSGCLTCRARRVKCDEQHPTCERCNKGSRICVYPEPRTAASSASKRVHVRPPGALEDDAAKMQCTNLQDQGRPDSPFLRPQILPAPNKDSSARFGNRIAHSVEQLEPSIQSPDGSKDRSLSPMTDDSGVSSSSNSTPTYFSQREAPSSSSNSSPDTGPWSHLPEKTQYYLAYHKNHLTYHHYFLRHQSDSFLHTILFDQALSYEPLLFALVGFAAFQEAVTISNGKIENFLGYYNKSVSLLRLSLSRGEEHSQNMLLTILQLATIEVLPLSFPLLYKLAINSYKEYLGDWVNVVGHQKAAHRMLLELYSPETIMEDELQRKILSWYSRFDLTAGLISGYETSLGRDWFCAREEYYRQQSEGHPHDINYKIETAIARHCLNAMDMALLLARLSREALGVEEFKIENEELSMRISTWEQDLYTLFDEVRCQVKTFEIKRRRDSKDVVDPHMPGGIFLEGLCSLNLLLMDWYGLDLMHKYQTALIDQQSQPPKLPLIALELCRMFEAIDCWPEAPPGVVLSTQASLSMATLFLPKDHRNIMWCRRKLARIESLGYIFPPTYRDKVAQLWCLPEVCHWWLPNDEGYPSIVRTIREIMEDRSPGDSDGTDGKTKSQDLRNLKAIFSKISLNDI